MSARPAALADLVPADKIGDAVDATLVRFCDLLRSAPDGSIPVPGLTWTVGELGAHLVTGAQLWRRMLAGDDHFPERRFRTHGAHACRGETCRQTQLSVCAPQARGVPMTVRPQTKTDVDTAAAT
jgi:hypothetical protein